MEQNQFQSSKGLPGEITGRVDRILEEMRIEGISVLDFPGQLLAVFLIEIIGHLKEEDRWKKNPFFYEKSREGAEDIFHEALEFIDDKSYISNYMREIQLFSSGQVLANLWDLGKRMCEFYPGLEPELERIYTGYEELKFQPLEELMDYLVERIPCRGDEGIFFTPRNLAIFVAELVNPRRGKVWDPASGSGTLLIQAAKQVEKNNGTCQMEGYEINRRMVHFARANALLHGLSSRTVEWKETDTIKESRDQAGMEKYDYIFANPPVSSVSDNKREEFGYWMPTRKLHLQFLQVILSRLKENGRAVIFVNESFLFGENRAERTIRQVLVDDFGLRAVISLPQGAFAPYTSAKASILFLDRSFAHEQPVSFYELKVLGYTLDKKRRQIAENDIPKVLEAEADRESRFQEWEQKIEENSQYNEQGLIVPADWKYEMGWFAQRDKIRERDYSLMGSIYSITPKEIRKPRTSPGELLQKLKKMEQESSDLLKQLLGLGL